jgi:hypothetical protein
LIECWVGNFLNLNSATTITTTTKPLIPNKLGYARNETQSKIIKIKIDNSLFKFILFIYLYTLFEFGMPGWKRCGPRADKSFGEARS